MARILVQADDGGTVLLDERNVTPVHLHTEQSAAQLLERVEWAVEDEAERRKPRRARIAAHESALTRSFD